MRISFEQVLIYIAFYMEFPQHILRSTLVKADQSDLFMDLTGWFGFLGLIN